MPVAFHVMEEILQIVALLLPSVHFVSHFLFNCPYYNLGY